MKNKEDKEIKEAQKVQDEIYDDFLQHLNKKYPNIDIGLLVFNQFHNLATHLWEHNSWPTEDLVGHLVGHFEILVKRKAEEEEYERLRKENDPTEEETNGK